MSTHIRRHVVAYVALFVALGGTAVALPGKNQVDSGDIKKAQVKKGDLAPNSVDGSKVVDNSLKGDDVDESSLDIDFPQQEIPTTLPPSGAAGGDLSGTYPDPQVQESGLLAGGDLTGSLANAQVSEGGLTAAGDVTGALNATAIANNSIGAVENGSPADDEIADESIDDDDIENSERQLLIPASTIGPAALDGTDEPDAGTISGLPAIMFSPTTNETLTLTVPVPDDIASGNFISIEWYFASPSGGTVRWTNDEATITPNVGDTLAGDLANEGGGSAQLALAADELRSTGNGGTNFSSAPGDLFRFTVTRDAASTSDNIGSDVALLAIQIEFRTRR